jgi:hypothetical protein
VKSSFFLDLNRSYYITDGSVLGFLKSCQKLGTLALSFCDRITDVSISKISEYCHNLKSLDISYNHNVTESALMKIGAGCSNFRVLNYNFYQISTIRKRRIAEKYPNVKSSSKWADIESRNQTDHMMFDYLDGDHGDY